MRNRNRNDSQLSAHLSSLFSSISMRSSDTSVEPGIESADTSTSVLSSYVFLVPWKAGFMNYGLEKFCNKELFSLKV